jgi:hypothetical protein
MVITMGSVRSPRRAAEYDRLARNPQALRGYAFLADGCRGALLDPDGEVAWLCFPSWADPAVFAGLLGGAGTHHLAPSARRVTGGFYEEGTLIWHQRWVTDDGVTECTEALAYPGEPYRCVLIQRVTAIDNDAMIHCCLVVAPD